MILHSDPLFIISFSGARHALDRSIFEGPTTQDEFWNYKELIPIKKFMQLNNLILLKQKHSTKGVIVDNNNIDLLLNKKEEGDFLITRLEKVGLGIYTADCLPIIFFDTVNCIIGLCHAGWQGALDKIAIKTIEKMQKTYGTDLNHLRIFFGPSAKRCCYNVNDDFVQKLEDFYFIDQVLVKDNGQFFFDLPNFNRLQLEQLGIKKEAFHTNYNICTICDNYFCSYRRDKQSFKRQLTVVALK